MNQTKSNQLHVHLTPKEQFLLDLKTDKDYNSYKESCKIKTYTNGTEHVFGSYGVVNATRSNLFKSINL